MNLNFTQVATRLPDAKLIRHLRISAGMTTRQLSLLMECNNSLITHFESGRNPLPTHRQRQICHIFNMTSEDYELYATGVKPIPINYLDECILLVSKMEQLKLQAVYGILANMSN
jgi:transcriptional regulator with XRE-family HTH domain